MKLVERVIVFEVFKECFYWYPSTLEHGGTTEYLGVDGDKIARVHVTCRLSPRGYSVVRTWTLRPWNSTVPGLRAKMV
jgi:hypothetical protein